MFVSVKVHQATLQELAAVRAKYEILEREHAGQQTTLTWQILRINQLEKERAILFGRVTNLPIPVPELVQNAIPSSIPLASDALFEDMGDAAAKRAGIDHDDEGVVRYTQ